MDTNDNKLPTKRPTKKSFIARIAALGGAIIVFFTGGGKFVETASDLSEESKNAKASEERVERAEEMFKQDFEKAQEVKEEKMEEQVPTLNEMKKAYCERYNKIKVAEQLKPEDIDIIKKELGNETVIAVRVAQQDNFYIEASNVNGKPVEIESYRALTQRYNETETPQDFQTVLGDANDENLSFAKLFYDYNKMMEERGKPETEQVYRELRNNFLGDYNNYNIGTISKKTPAERAADEVTKEYYGQQSNDIDHDGRE